MSIHDTPPSDLQRLRYANLSWQAEQARQAQAVGDLRGMTEAGHKMERFGYYKEAWRTLHQAALLDQPTDHRLWRGPRDDAQVLVVQRRLRDLGDELRQVHLVAKAAEDVRRVVVLTEPRLVPLFQRSFPRVTFIDDPAEAPHGQRVAVTSYEQLAFFYADEEESIRSGFAPLIPPPSSPADRRGLGISWYSKAMYKTLPDLEDWATLLAGVTGRVQSLQYQEGRAGLNNLVQQSGRPIKAARTIDQFVDLDRYAGQVASVRHVLTISNTTAHMAGALGIPCVVILDKESVTTWPDHGDHSPFYPNTRLIRRQGDGWEGTLAEAYELLLQIKPGRGSLATPSKR